MRCLKQFSLEVSLRLLKLAIKSAVILIAQNLAAQSGMTVVLKWEIPTNITADSVFKIYSHTNIALPITSWPVVAVTAPTNRTLRFPIDSKLRWYTMSVSNGIGENCCTNKMQCAKQFSLEIAAGVQITSPSLLPEIAAYDFSWTYQLEAAGGTPPYTWSFIAGSPDWVDPQDAGGLLTAVPNTHFSDLPFNDVFTMRVTDSSGPPLQTEKQFTVPCIHAIICPNWASIPVNGTFGQITGNGGSFGGTVTVAGGGEAFDTDHLAVSGMKCSMGKLTWNWSIATVGDARVQVVANTGVLRTAGVIAGSGSGGAELQFGVSPSVTEVWLRFQVGSGSGDVTVSGSVTNEDVLPP